MSAPRPQKFALGAEGRMPPRQRASRSPVKDAPVEGPGNEVEETVPDELPLVDRKLLEPSIATLVKLEARGPQALEKAQQKSREQAIQTIHALRLLAPGVLAAGLGSANGPDQVSRFLEWMAGVQEAARRGAEKWGVEPSDRPWIQGSLERVMAENPSLVGSDKALSLLMGLAEGLAPPPTLPWLPSDAQAPLALLQALAPVQRVQKAFPFGRLQPEKDLEEAARLLVEAGQDAVLEMVDPASSSEVRLTVFVAAVTEAGKTMAQVWMHHGQMAQASAQGRTDSDRALWERAHPEGEAIGPVFKDFQEMMARLRRLARLARPRA